MASQEIVNDYLPNLLVIPAKSEESDIVSLSLALNVFCAVFNGLVLSSVPLEKPLQIVVIKETSLADYF